MRPLLKALSAVIALALASPSGAGETVRTTGKLSDQAFYGVVACGVAPGETCKGPLLKWPVEKRRRLTVAITRNDPGFPEDEAAQIRQGIANALNEINGVGAGVQLQWVKASKADIEIKLIDTAQQRLLEPTKDWVEDFGRLTADISSTVFYDRRNGRISRGEVLVGPGFSRRSIKPVMLKRLTQCLGLMSEIDNRRYGNRSVFSADRIRTSKLEGQDAAVLRMHYPPGG